MRDHYASHLAPIYLWMAGGFDNALALGKSDLKALGIEARTGMVALALGAGFGMHAIPLARAGCAVTALDSSATLLNELRAHADGLSIRVTEGDLLNVASYVTEAPQLVLCMGDTLTQCRPGRRSKISSRKVSSYRKLPLSAQWASAALRRAGLDPAMCGGPRGMVQITARGPGR